MKGIFITGTDTDAGKTVVTQGILHALRQRGVSAMLSKPVQTGVRQGVAPDFDTVLQNLSISLPAEHRSVLLPFCFEAATSPHLASRLEPQRPIPTVRAIAENLRQAEIWYDFLVVEGAGGLYVPLNDTETMLDLAAALDFPTILVVRNTLGCLNHARLSLEAIQRAGISCLGWILCETTPPLDALEETIRRDTRPSLSARTTLPCLAEIPWQNVSETVPLWKDVPDALLEMLTPIPPTPPEDLLSFDRQHLFHPYTSITAPLPVYAVSSARKTTLQTVDGQTLTDGMASWWCAIHGYSHPRLVSAIQQQAAKMAHVMFGGITHPPAVTLGKKLLEMLAQHLERSPFEHIFFADSGSIAVEVALKMAFQYWKQRGVENRTKLLTLRGGYHGDTFGAMSVCDPVTGMHSLFQGILPQHYFAPRPQCRFHDPWQEADFHPFRRLVEEYHAEIAAVILEPIVQGAGGMWFYHPQYLREVHALCDRYGILLIFDEIATGFGRTGKMFAMEHTEVVPDILCLGKALTGGMLSLAAVLAQPKVTENVGTLMHGPTFMANPLACAAACASLELLQTTPWQAQVQKIETILQEEWTPLAQLPGVREIRVLGAIGVVECADDIPVAAFQQFCVRCGGWIRPFGKLIYLMPPYVIQESELRHLCQIVRSWCESL